MSDSYPGVLPVFGPLAPPPRPHLPGPARCGCNPSYGESCEGCDGTRAEDREFWSATPAQRREYLRQLAAWRRATDAPTTYAQEAS